MKIRISRSKIRKPIRRAGFSQKINRKNEEEALENL
jgi:hypothetical protein